MNKLQANLPFMDSIMTERDSKGEGLRLSLFGSRRREVISLSASFVEFIGVISGEISARSGYQSKSDSLVGEEQVSQFYGDGRKVVCGLCDLGFRGGRLACSSPVRNTEQQLPTQKPNNVSTPRI
jgi:hypothetical protein